MKIGLTGATGFVGSHLAEYFVQTGHRVTCLVRENSNRQKIGHLKIQFVTGDVNQIDTLKDFVQNQDIIIHAAGLTKAKTEAKYYQTNTVGTECLLIAIQKYNPTIKRFVFISSQAAVGPSTLERPVSETDQMQPVTAYGRSKAEAEKATRKFGTLFPVTIVRPPAIYGPYDRDVFIYFKIIRFGFLPIIHDESRINVLFIKNLIHGIDAVMKHPNAIGNCYFLADDGQYSWDELGQMIADVLRKKPKKIKIPMPLIQFIVLLITIYNKVSKKAIIVNRDKLKEMKQPFWLVSNQKAKNELNFFPPYSTKDAIRETAGWYIENSWF